MGIHILSQNGIMIKTLFSTFDLKVCEDEKESKFQNRK
jgi:hypothetical protein